MNVYRSVETLASDRDRWESILAKLKSREMPPDDAVIQPSDEQIHTLVKLLEKEFERADAAMKPDPGRVTARRLNRAEYTNTIRDLLAVDFRADRNFPTDDSGEGFDNIADVLTVSPVLMEKYLAAAGRIAERAIATGSLPKPIEVEYSLRFKNLRRIDPSNVEATHRFDFDAEYELKIGLPGQRAKDAAPVTLGLWIDGKLVQTTRVETKPSGLVYFNPLSEERIRVPVTEGDHTLRLGFIDDPFVKTLAQDEIYKDTVNKWIGAVTVIGPFASAGEKPSRKKILVCDPATGPRCVDRILATLARRAYRRPVTGTEVAALKKFVDMAVADGQSVEQGIGLAIQAMLVSPHFLFHIERDLYPNDPGRMHRISDVELASRLSYFLWNSMPDDELLSLAERRRLSVRQVLDAQVERMLADPKSSAMAENFAGQWLEIRNLDTIKPDPQKFPAWTPELRDAMKTETRMFFDSILRDNRPVGDFIDARYTFLNELLAKHYGIDGVTGPEFRRVDLTTAERGGVLTHGSVLAVSSYPTRTSVVIRGKYILQNILGTPPPPPPADVPALDEQAVGTTASLRKQMENPSHQRDLRLVPRAHGSARLRARELRRHREMADDGRRLPGGFERRAARRKEVLEPRRDAPDPRRTRARAHADADREAPDLQPRPRPPALRPTDRERHRQESGRLGLWVPDAGPGSRAQPAVPVAAGGRSEDGCSCEVAVSYQLSAGLAEAQSAKAGSFRLQAEDHYAIP